jgi:hypothetical protein
MTTPEVLIWWLTPKEADAVVWAYKRRFVDMPDYMATQATSLAGRAARGRLWCADDIECPEVDEDYFTTTVGQLCLVRGGIVFYAADYERVKRGPGFVTNFQLQSLNLDKAHRE